MTRSFYDEWYWRESKDGVFSYTSRYPISGDFSAGAPLISVHNNTIEFRPQALIDVMPECRVKDGSGYHFEFASDALLELPLKILIYEAFPPVQGSRWAGLIMIPYRVEEDITA